MNYLLKIVEGPNKGAEIALVEGVAITLGKGDDCDIVLADATLPDAPLSIEASESGVTVDGSPLEPFAVRIAGATAFAVGPADAPWGALKWPKVEKEDESGSETGDAERADAADSPSHDARPAPSEDAAAVSRKKKRGCGCGCLVAAIVVLLLLAGLVWVFRDELRKSDRFDQLEKIGRGWYSRMSGGPGMSVETSPSNTVTLSDVAQKYGISLIVSNGMTRLSGNFATRRERLAATAEVYAAQPGVDLDLSDDESFRTAAEDALFTLTEGTLKIVVATNRCLAIGGFAPSPAYLGKALRSLAGDLPKLAAVDTAGVSMGGVETPETYETVDFGHEEPVPASRAPRLASKKRRALPALPVCGILTTPYPCLVMRDGRRVMEGATIGDGIILEIGADSVVLTNSTGRFTWKP